MVVIKAISDIVVIEAIAAIAAIASKDPSDTTVARGTPSQHSINKLEQK